MKGKVFGLILLTTLGIAIMNYFGYFGGDTIQIKCRYADYDCGEKNINMTVVAVSDSSLLHLVGKTVAPEISFRQAKLNDFIKARLKSNSKESEMFFVVGKLKERPIRHCSGATCFKVDMIKLENETDYTEF